MGDGGGLLGGPAEGFVKGGRGHLRVFSFAFIFKGRTWGMEWVGYFFFFYAVFRVM